MTNLETRLELISEIKELESKLIQILEYSEEGIISCDEKERIILFNNGAEKIFGYTKEEVLGQGLSILLPSDYREKHGEHFQEFIKSGNQARHMSPKRNIFGLRKDGTEINLNASISNLETKEGNIATVFLRDTTLEVKYLDEIKHAEERLASIIEIAEDAIISVNSDMKIVIFNRGAQKIFGYGTSEIIGESLDKLLPMRFRKKHAEHMHQFAVNHNYARMMADRQEIFGLRKDGVEFHAEASISIIEIKGEKLFTVILRDISDRKLIEAQLRDNIIRLEELNQNKDKYLSVLAHDLKNPLGGLMGYIQLLREDWKTFEKDDIKTILNSMYKISNNIHDLLDNLLNWSRLQLNKVVFEPEKFDINELMFNTRDFLDELAKIKGIKILVDSRSSYMVEADRNMIFTVLRNLVNNSIKFCNNGDRIFIRAKEENDNIVVEVEDEGIGMSSDTVAKLFRTDVDKVKLGTNNEKGHGYGLLLCKEFVEKNNGTIRVWSEEGVGTKISFLLPKA